MSKQVESWDLSLKGERCTHDGCEVHFYAKKF